jgi:hypothetical protein
MVISSLGLCGPVLMMRRGGREEILPAQPRKPELDGSTD